jgi:hypothetical protein
VCVVARIGVTLVCKRELIYCGVFLLLPFGPSAGQNASNTVWGGIILSILPLLSSHKNTFEYSNPGGR